MSTIIHVTATIGIGMWKVTKKAMLVACPHVGDDVVIGEIDMTCEHVTIGENMVYIDQTVRFEKEEDMNNYLEDGWTRT